MFSPLFSRQGLPVQPSLAWDSLSTPGHQVGLDLSDTLQSVLKLKVCATRPLQILLKAKQNYMSNDLDLPNIFLQRHEVIGKAMIGKFLFYSFISLSFYFRLFPS